MELARFHVKYETKSEDPVAGAAVIFYHFLWIQFALRINIDDIRSKFDLYVNDSNFSFDTSRTIKSDEEE